METKILFEDILESVDSGKTVLIKGYGKVIKDVSFNYILVSDSGEKKTFTLKNFEQNVYISDVMIDGKTLPEFIERRLNDAAKVFARYMPNDVFSELTLLVLNKIKDRT